MLIHCIRMIEIIFSNCDRKNMRIWKAALYEKLPTPSKGLNIINTFKYTRYTDKDTHEYITKSYIKTLLTYLIYTNALTHAIHKYITLWESVSENRLYTNLEKNMRLWEKMKSHATSIARNLKHRLPPTRCCWRELDRVASGLGAHYSENIGNARMHSDTNYTKNRKWTFRFLLRYARFLAVLIFRISISEIYFPDYNIYCSAYWNYFFTT